MEPLRPLTLGELLDRTFQVYRNNFLLFTGIAAVAYLPMFIVRSGLVFAPKLGGGSAAVAVGVGVLLFAVMDLVGTAAAQSGTIIAVSAVHLSQPITIGEAYRRVWGMLGRIVLLMIGIGIGVGIGLLLLVVPGKPDWELAGPATISSNPDLGHLSEEDLVVIETYLHRRLDLDPMVRINTAIRISQLVGRKTGLQRASGQSDDDFLETIARETRDQARFRSAGVHDVS
jgi:hypothetical protein